MPGADAASPAEDGGSQRLNLQSVENSGGWNCLKGMSITSMPERSSHLAWFISLKPRQRPHVSLNTTAFGQLSTPLSGRISSPARPRGDAAKPVILAMEVRHAGVGGHIFTDDPTRVVLARLIFAGSRQQVPQTRFGQVVAYDPFWSWGVPVEGGRAPSRSDGELEQVAVG